MSTELGYAAGLMDGEGSIQITKDKCLTSRRGYKYQLQVSMCSTRPEFLLWLKENFEGSFFLSGKTSIGNPVYHWELTSRKAGKLLAQILPYLMTKRNKAEIALRFQERVARKEGHVGRRGYTEEQWNWFAEQKRLIEVTK